jgi:hypothetical protein
LPFSFPRRSDRRAVGIGCGVLDRSQVCEAPAEQLCGLVSFTVSLTVNRPQIISEKRAGSPEQTCEKSLCNMHKEMSSETMTELRLLVNCAF